MAAQTLSEAWNQATLIGFGILIVLGTMAVFITAVVPDDKNEEKKEEKEDKE